MRWFSYTFHEGPYDTVDSDINRCMISVVLDEARHEFSAIRLLIISEQSTGVDDVVIHNSYKTRAEILSGLEEDEFEEDEFEIEQIRCERLAEAIKLYPTYRDFLSRNRNSRQQIQNLSMGDRPASGLLNVFNVTFQLIANPSDVVTLVPCPHILTGSYFHTLYDYTYTCEPENLSLIVFLDSNGYFGKDSFTMDRDFPPAHSLRVIPNVRHRRFAFTLTPEIILRIAGYNVNKECNGWRLGLFCCGLVCKSWVHVLDLFFKTFDGSDNADPPDPHRVARSLEARPERGALMRTFNPNQQYATHDGRPTPKVWFDVITILKFATSVEEIHLYTPGIPASVIDMLVHALSNLRLVRTLYLVGGMGRFRGSLSLAAIQTMMRNWQYVRHVRLENCFQEEESEPESSFDELPCMIHSLEIFDGKITQPQLMRFVSKPTPSLTSLYLHMVPGLSNGDIYVILVTVAPTLIELDIRERTIPYLQAGTDEELALDAVMPEMRALTTVRVSGNYASTHSLSRKTSPTLEEKIPHTKRSIWIYLDTALDMDLKEVAKAITQTGWEIILLEWMVGRSALDKTLIEEAELVAKQRGIELKFLFPLHVH